MKTCIEPGCTRPIFSHLLCAYHQFRRKQQGGDLFKRKAPIKKRSEKRAKDERYYADKAREFFDEAVKNGTNFCFFCDGKVERLDGLHHLEGRQEKKLLNFDLIVIVHNDCHVYKYHMMSYEQRIKQVWWNDFLVRLKSKSEELWHKEIRKGEKVHRINPEKELFDED